MARPKGDHRGFDEFAGGQPTGPAQGGQHIELLQLHAVTGELDAQSVHAPSCTVRVTRYTIYVSVIPAM